MHLFTARYEYQLARFARCVDLQLQLWTNTLARTNTATG